MRIISCYIEGYGKIKQREFSFDEGITTVFWENGEGKSTLASFLKAMLYGLKGYSKRSTEFCDREHFYPFDGGLFGGNLHLEANGKRYKIERFFGDKSETADRLTVYEDGREMKDAPVDIGRLLLGMDKESFERTAFLRYEDLEIASTDGIHARLNRFLEGGEEDGGLDKALEAVDKAAKTYKKRGGGDKITQAKERVDRLKAQIENTSLVKASLEEKYGRAKALEGEIKNCQEAIAVAQKQREIASQFEHYDSIVEEVEKAEKEMASLKEKYPLGVPTLEETKAFNAYLVAANELQIKMEGSKLSAKEEGELAALQARFDGGVPTQEDCKRVEEKIDALKSLQGERKGRIPSPREEELRARFARRRPSPERLAAAERGLSAYRDKKREMERISALPQQKSRSFSAKPYAWIAVIAAIVGVLGGVLLFMQVAFGSALGLIGAFVLLCDGFFYLNKKTARQSVPVVNPLLLEAERELAEFAKGLESLLFSFGYGGEEGIEVGFDRLKRDLEDLEVLERSQAEEEALLFEKSEKTAALEGELTDFFRRYGAEGEGYFARLTNLQAAADKLQSLLKRKKEGEEACAVAQEERAALLEKTGAYREKYGLLSVDVEELLEDARRLERALSSVKIGREKAAVFKAEKGLGERAENASISVEERSEALARLQDEKARLLREIDEDERTAELLEGYESEKKEAEEELKAYKRKHKLLEATGALLNEAAGRLRDKYVKPVKDEFLKYAALLERALGEKVVMTKDFTLRFERNGVERSERHLSSGQRSICALCFRLALLKNMYEGQMPFLVLDDPFVALDEEHIARVKELLQVLSKDMQMVYFTCHSSRKV